MGKGICPAEGCLRPISRRGYCKSCYYRLKARGVITNLPVAPSAHERFEELIKKTPEGCWEWQGGRNNLGYGKLNLPGRKRVYAHRFSYEKYIGPIPDGLELDHLCRNPPCVNPDHLEPVTHQENLLRSAPVVARDGCCEKGHLLTDNSVYWSNGERWCKTCCHDRYLKRKARLMGMDA